MTGEREGGKGGRERRREAQKREEWREGEGGKGGKEGGREREGRKEGERETHHLRTPTAYYQV